jgi:large repetitive protein
MRTLRMQYILISIFILAVMTLSGCSSGGSGQAAGSPPLSATVSATAATGGELKLATAGMPNTIAGIDLTVNLPAGVSVNADSVTGETTSGVVAISGAAAGSNNLVSAKYTPASNGAPSRLRIIVISASGFSLGEFLTVRFDQTAGTSLPEPAAFTVANFSARGIDGSTLSEITAAPLSVDAVGNAAIKALVTVVGTPPPNLSMTVDTPTKYRTQTITGTLNTGLTLTVTASAPAIVSGLTITGINWSALVSGLADGPNTITATATGVAGIVTASATIVVDRVPPFINIDTTLITQNDSIGISGTTEVNSTITVTCDHATADVVPVNDLVQNVTRWSAMILGLLEGVNHCVVTAVDAAGNENAVKADITRDSTPPSLSISATTPAKTGSTQTITGTVESGATPTVTANTSATVGPVTVTGSTWSCTVSGLPAGDTAISVTAKDAAGNVTTKTATITAFNTTGSFTGAAQPSVTDALKALRIAVGLDVPTPVDIIYGDLYADNFIDIADAILILEKAVGLFDNVLGFNNLYPHLLSSPGR